MSWANDPRVDGEEEIMSTSVVHPARASQSTARSRAIGLGLAGLVLTAGVGLGLSANRSDPVPAVESSVTHYEPSAQARRLEALAEDRAALSSRQSPLDGSIRRS
jgi:hypothetical protein